MYNFVVERIKKKQHPIKRISPIVEEPRIMNRIDEDIPLEEEELRNLIQKIFIIEESIPPKPLILQFFHVWDFSEWYLPRRESFTEAQKIALDTIVQTRDGINSGCACKRGKREQKALQYWRLFWTGNSKNDLLPTILKIAEVEKVEIVNLLVYPS